MRGDRMPHRLFCWATRLVLLRFFRIRAPTPLYRPFTLLLLALLVAPLASEAQLATGFLECAVHNAHGQPAVHAAILVAGSTGFKVVVHTNSAGRFTLSLPYGTYLLSNGRSHAPTQAAVAVVVAPLQTTRVNLAVDNSGSLRDSPPDEAPSSERPVASFGLWSDNTRASTFPEGFSLQSSLLSREPASVTVPLDFTGITDNRLALVSERAFSWTGTEFKLQGLDATDSYQPGRPAIVPDVQAISDIVMRTSPALTTSEAYGAEIGSFIAEPGTSWHAAVSTFDTGSVFSSDNLPALNQRGAIQQPGRFNWFTRARLEAGGPLSKWADVFASAVGRWASQTIELAPPRQDQNSRMFLGTLRSRIRASTRDQFEAEYTGSRVHLSNWGMPAGIEALVGRRMSPQFELPDGFPDQAERDDLNFVQFGWTRLFPGVASVGAFEVRYGYSLDHFFTWPSVQTIPNQSRIELFGSTITGAPPLDTLADRSRHEIAGAWQPGAVFSGRFRHQITAGGNWSLSSPRNRFSSPSDLNVITAESAPAFVVEYNTPLDSRARIHSTSAYFADHLVAGEGFSIDLGALADFPRGSLPAQSSPAGSFTSTRSFSAREDLIAWNNISPRAGFAWQIPRAHGLLVSGTYLRVYSPLAGRYLDYANPNSLGGSVYRWIDRNGDGWFQSDEQGALLLRFGGPYSSISPSLQRPYADEFDVGWQVALTRKSFARIQLFRRDEKHRIVAIDTGLAANAFTPISIFDPGPDGIPGTFDDQHLTVYQQNPASFGSDQYLLTNAPGLRTLNDGFVADMGAGWRRLMVHASFTAEKAWGPTNPGDAVFENDPGVIGSLFTDPNSATLTLARSFVDRAFLGKIQATYRLPSAWGGLQLATLADYLDGLPFARQLLVSGLPQGPFLVATTVRGSPEGGNRAQYVLNWNLRLQREFRLRAGHITASADILNVVNAGQKVQESDLSGTAFNSRLPVAIQEPRFVRFGFAYSF